MPGARNLVTIAGDRHLGQSNVDTEGPATAGVGEEVVDQVGQHVASGRVGPAHDRCRPGRRVEAAVGQERGNCMGRGTEREPACQGVGLFVAGDATEPVAALSSPYHHHIGQLARPETVGDPQAGARGEGLAPAGLVTVVIGARVLGRPTATTTPAYQHRGRAAPAAGRVPMVGAGGHETSGVRSQAIIWRTTW